MAGGDRGAFEQANIAVTEAAYLNVEWTQTADGISADQTPPDPDDGVGAGVATRKSTRAIIAVWPSSGQTVDCQVYAYLAGPAKWVELEEAERTGITATGNSWKINTGGATEIAVILTNLSGGTADAWFGRSYVV